RVLIVEVEPVLAGQHERRSGAPRDLSANGADGVRMVKRDLRDVVASRGRPPECELRTNVSQRSFQIRTVPRTWSVTLLQNARVDTRFNDGFLINARAHDASMSDVIGPR